jgi:hypothetical protein
MMRCPNPPEPAVMAPSAGDREVVNDEVLIEATPARPCGAFGMKLL